MRSNYGHTGAGMEPYSQNTAYPSYNNNSNPHKPTYDPGMAPGGYNMNNYQHA